MKTDIRVAFVAIRRDPDTGNRQALILGTAIKGSSEIRLVRVVPAQDLLAIKEAELDRLHAILSDNSDLQTVDPLTLRKTFAGSAYTTGESDVDDLQNAIVFGHVERFMAFKYDRGPGGQLTPKILPLLVVDAANGPLPDVGQPIYRRSRISIQFNTNATIKGFAVELFVRLAGSPIQSDGATGPSNGIVRLRRVGLHSASQNLFDQSGYPYTLACGQISIGHAFKTRDSRELRESDVVWHAQYDDTPSGLLRFAVAPWPAPPVGSWEKFDQPPALLSSLGIVPGDQYGRYEDRAFLFEPWTMSADERSERLVLRLQGRVELVPDSSRPLIPGFPIDLMAKQPSFELVQRQEPESTFVDALFEPQPTSHWSIQLRPHQDWLRSDQSDLRPWFKGSLEQWAEAWNRQVAREIGSALDLVSARSAMSMLPTFDLTASSRSSWTMIWVLHGRLEDNSPGERLVRFAGDSSVQAAFQGFAPHFAESALMPAASRAQPFRVDSARIFYQALRDHSGAAIAYEGSLSTPRLATPGPEALDPVPAKYVPSGRIDIGWVSDALSLARAAMHFTSN